MSHLLGKKRTVEAVTSDDAKYLILPIESFSDEQVAALQGARATLPAAFQCLSPILEKLLSAYEERNRTVPPHMRTPKVRKTHAKWI